MDNNFLDAAGMQPKSIELESELVNVLNNPTEDSILVSTHLLQDLYLELFSYRDRK